MSKAYITQLHLLRDERAGTKMARRNIQAEDGPGKKWLKDNTVGMIGLAVLVVGAFMAYAKLESKVDALSKSVDTNSSHIETNYNKIEAHEKDTSRHIDPQRDKELWDDLKRRLQRIEEKLDKK